MIDRERPPEGALNAPLPTSGPVPSAVLLRLVQLGAAAWLLFHLLAPLRYYVDAEHDAYDERFAWRMFSAVRVQSCDVSVVETQFGHGRIVQLPQSLPLPWISLLERNRPAVVDAYLEHRCAGGEPERVALVSRCTDAAGEALPTATRTLECATHTFENTTESRPEARPEGGTP